MELKQKIEDLFDKEICVECDAKCHFGSGRYVNRYPYYGDEYYWEYSLIYVVLAEGEKWWLFEEEKELFNKEDE